jgi:hypothetical protein
VEKVIEIWHLAPLRDMGSPWLMTNVLKELVKSIRGKGITIGMNPRISKEVLKNMLLSLTTLISVHTYIIIMIRRS